MSYFVFQPTNYIFLGSFPILVETFFLVMGFCFFIYWIAREMRKEKLLISSFDRFMFFFSVIFLSLAGGRIWYFLNNWNGWKTLIDIFDLRLPGLTSFGMIFGGIIGIFLFSSIYSKKSKGKEEFKALFAKYIDIAAPAAALFVFIYRMGCFHFGDVPGTETRLPWGMFALNYQQHTGLIIHPTALYLSFSALLIFIFLHWYKERKKFTGEIGELFLILYSFNRFWIEFFRNDTDFINQSQTVLIWIFFISLLLYGLGYFNSVYFFRNPKRIPPKDAKIVSPADGRILYVKEVKEGEVPISVKGKNKILLKDILKSDIPCKRGVLIGIYLALTDVHYQRAPISGKIMNTFYYRTGFNYSFCRMLIRKLLDLKPWYKDCKHLLENERNLVEFKGKYDIFVTQIAEKVVNRIDCYVKKGDSVEMGKVYGLIKMGSQVDIFIADVTLDNIQKLRLGQGVKSGVTKIA